MNKPSIVENALYRVSEDVGTACGVLGGALAGTIDVAILPTYLRKNLTEEGPGIALHDYPAGNVAGVGDIVSQVSDYVPPEQGRLSRIKQIGSEAFDRLATAGYATTHTTRNLFRWGVTIGAILDWTDGRPEFLGYLAIPALASLLLEGARAVHRFRLRRRISDE